MRFIFYFIILRWFFRILLCSQTDPIETLIVRIEGDFSRLLDAADEGVDRTTDRLEDLDGAAQRSGAGMSRGAAVAGAAFGLAATAASGLLNIVINLVASTVDLFKNLTSRAIQLAGDFEQVQLTFTNIFKDKGQADAFLKGLQTEAAKLGVSFNSAGQFAKSLFPDTSGVEQFNELLRIGAVAAADANLPLEDLIFTLNNAVAGQFDSIKDILDLPPETLAELREAPGDIDVLITSLDKLFTKRGVNNLEAAGSTLQGLQRRIKGFTEELLLTAGLEILGPLREGFQSFFDLLEANRPALDEISSGIGEIIGIVVEFASQNIFGDLDLSGPVESVKSFVEGIKSVIGSILAFGKEAAKFISSFSFIGNIILSIAGVVGKLIIQFTGAGVVIKMLSDRVKEAGGFLPAFNKAMIAGAQATAIITAVIKGLTETVKGALSALGGMGKAIAGLLTGNMDKLKAGLIQANDGLNQVSQGGAEAFKESMLESAKSIDAMTNPLEDVTEEVKGLDKAMSDAADTAEAKPLLDPGQLEKFGDQLAEAAENRAKQQAALEADNAEKVAKIIEDANQKRLDIDQKFNDALAGLAKDSADKRAKIVQDTRQKLGKLEESTDRELSARRKEFNKDELRETEDHLKEMRRLEEDFLFNLDDAVRERDAGAIVDLQRQFQKESSQREEDFSTNQNRQGKDFDAELAGIRKNEADKREELLAAQAQELDNINKFEEEKRANLEATRQEDQQQLEQDLAEKLQKENQNFMERQAALDEAMQKQLESIAKNLADQKDVTEEGAREILETFDQFFGIGGDIDSLMEDFARKRKIRADITVAFEGKSAPEPDTGGEPKPPGAGGGSFGGRKRLGGVQEFATGGTLIADKPTLALFGEAGPEVVQFTPMSQLSSPGQSEPGRMIVELKGSAPPGIGSAQVDQIAGVLLQALDESGALN
jgi:hypothetical protein